MKRMPEDYYGRAEGEHRRKKHKKKHFLRSFLMLIFGCAIFILSFLLLFHIRKIEVSGNQYCSADEVVGWLQKDKFATNSLYVWVKHRYTDVEQLMLVEESEVTLRNPWTVRVRVYEKEIIGYLEVGNQNIYFDKDGVVVMLSDQTVLDDVQKIEGIEVELSKVEAHKRLPVQNKDVFTAVLEVTQELQKSELAADQILFEGENVTLVFGTVTVLLGNGDLGDKIAQIQPILAKLQEQYPDAVGTLHLEKYSRMNSAVSFIPAS